MRKGFWSYARRDDRYGKITSLKKAFDQSLAEVTGEDVEIYMDTTHIYWGEAWQEAIDKGISESDFFIAVLTPSYFKRSHCLYEFEQAQEQGKKILPIYYRDVPIAKKKRKDFSLKAIEIAEATFRLEHRDFRALKHRDRQSEEVLTFLDEISDELANT